MLEQVALLPGWAARAPTGSVRQGRHGSEHHRPHGAAGIGARERGGFANCLYWFGDCISLARLSLSQYIDCMALT